MITSIALGSVISPIIMRHFDTTEWTCKYCKTRFSIYKNTYAFLRLWVKTFGKKREVFLSRSCVGGTSLDAVGTPRCACPRCKKSVLIWCYFSQFSYRGVNG